MNRRIPSLFAAGCIASVPLAVVACEDHDRSETSSSSSSGGAGDCGGPCPECGMGGVDCCYFPCPVCEELSTCAECVSCAYDYQPDTSPPKYCEEASAAAAVHPDGVAFYQCLVACVMGTVCASESACIDACRTAFPEAWALRRAALSCGVCGACAELCDGAPSSDSYYDCFDYLCASGQGGGGGHGAAGDEGI